VVFLSQKGAAAMTIIVLSLVFVSTVAVTLAVTALIFSIKEPA
jgi:hypothetical protein